MALWAFFVKLLSQFASNVVLPRRTATARFSRLQFEVLEDRLAPALITWTGGAGPGDQTWSNPANWEMNGGPAVPDQNADVRLTPAFNRPSIVDPMFQGTVRSVTIDAGYTEELTL